MTQISLFMKQRQNHRHRGQTAKGEGVGGGMEWEVGICRYIIIHRIENQQDSTMEHKELCIIPYDKP